MQNYLVRGSSLEGFRSSVESLDGDADELLKRNGLLEAERDPGRWASYYQFLLLLEDAAQTTHCPHFGLHLSRHQGISILGPVGFIIQQAPDLRTALRELGVHFIHHLQGATIAVQVQNGIAYWRFDCKLQGSAPVRHQQDLAAGIGVNMMRLFRNSSWVPKAVYFPHSPPQNVQPYRELFKCPLQFNADYLLMTFDADILNKPIDNANPHLHRLLAEHLANLRDSYPDDYCGQVRHLINQALTTGDCSIERVAGHLAVGKRTLQRQLKTHDTSYKDLLEEVRFDIAKRYLRESSGSLTALADMLCYSDLSTFSTAFRQHHGVSPRNWRKQSAILTSQKF